jgi:hypothetical protein
LGERLIFASRCFSSFPEDSAQFIRRNKLRVNKYCQHPFNSIHFRRENEIKSKGNGIKKVQQYNLKRKHLMSPRGIFDVYTEVTGLKNVNGSHHVAAAHYNSATAFN